MRAKFLASHCPACGKCHKRPQATNWAFRSYQLGPLLMLSVCWQCYPKTDADTRGVTDRIDAFLVKHGAIQPSAKA
jgi:hypothetical protein